MVSLSAPEQTLVPRPERSSLLSHGRPGTVPSHVVWATLLSILGVLSIFSTALYLWALWTTDPLKSIGGLIPVVSLILILRVWRALGWEREGSWWGLALLIATVGIVHWRDHAVLELVLSPSWSIFLPPHSVVAFAYVSGLVLLLGGKRLYRSALFPIFLVLLVNPVPHVFNRFIDLPLQHTSAVIARGFAHALGQRLSPDQLRLMFTPDFGMFIAPGCNGIRGSITMGVIALVAGYIYRFRARVWMMAVFAAVLLGYVFNLVRLCVLVLYYVVALHIPWLQSRAEMGDYLIGASLFFGATLLLFTLVQRCNGGELWPPPPRAVPAKIGAPGPARKWLPSAALGVVVALGCAGYARGLIASMRGPVQSAEGYFPARVGTFSLRRTWAETLNSGPKIFDWAEYVSPSTNAAIRVGISPVLGAHDTLLCHAARGEDWLWHGNLNLQSRSGAVNFSGSFFNEGARPYLEATTICSGDRCGQWNTTTKQFGLVYSRPEPRALLGLDPSRPIPVLLRTEVLDSSLPLDLAKADVLRQMQQFIGDASISDLTLPYRER